MDTPIEYPNVYIARTPHSISAKTMRGDLFMPSSPDTWNLQSLPTTARTEHQA